MIRNLPVFAGYILCLSFFSKLLFTVEQLYVSLYYINPLSPFDYDPFLIPDTRIGFRCRIHRSSKQFQVFHVNSSFFTVLFTGKVKSGRENPILQALDTFFASRDCINPCSTGILLYTAFTFKVPEHHSYIRIYYTILYQWPRCKSEGPIRPDPAPLLYIRPLNIYLLLLYTRSTVALCVPATAGFTFAAPLPYYSPPFHKIAIHFRHAPIPCRECTPLYCSRSRATTLHTPSQYISYSNIYPRSTVSDTHQFRVAYLLL
jgi:hypothetical protein